MASFKFIGFAIAIIILANVNISKGGEMNKNKGVANSAEEICLPGLGK